MKSKHCIVCSVVIIYLLLSGCASSNKVHIGAQYEPTGQIEMIFQVSQAPRSCRVFAHLFATMPANMTTNEFSNLIGEEAKTKGADVILIGQARRSVSESSLDFSYYGPTREYSIRDWAGWSFGLEDWNDQGGWTALGYSEWTRGDTYLDFPAVVQAVFLRCQ